MLRISTRGRLRWIALLMLILAAAACNLPNAAELGLIAATPTDAPEEEATEEVTPTEALIEPTEKPTEADTEEAEETEETEADEEEIEADVQVEIICDADAEYLSDVNISDGTAIIIGETFDKTWEIENTGDCDWDDTYQIVQIEGDMLIAEEESTELPDINAGETAEITVELTLSEAAEIGETYKATFQLRDPNGEFFGDKVFVMVQAADEEGSLNASISGTVWADRCDGDSCTSSGNIFGGGGSSGGDGIFNSGEVGIGGVTIQLSTGDGACPGTAITTTTTGASGWYTFTGLDAGNYCISIDASESANANVLGAGSWTAPAGYISGSRVDITISVAAGAEKTGINFGWDAN